MTFLKNGRVGKGEATMKLLPLSKVMWASSRNSCKKCIILIEGRRWDSYINDSINKRNRGRVLLIKGLGEAANI
jgi:hypothetical protein